MFVHRACGIKNVKMWYNIHTVILEQGKHAVEITPCTAHNISSQLIQPINILLKHAHNNTDSLWYFYSNKYFKMAQHSFIMKIIVLMLG